MLNPIAPIPLHPTLFRQACLVSAKWIEAASAHPEVKDLASGGLAA